MRYPQICEITDFSNEPQCGSVLPKTWVIGRRGIDAVQSKASMKKLGIRREYNLDQSPSWVNWHKISM